MGGIFDEIEKSNKKELDEYKHKALFLEIVAVLKKVYPKIEATMDYMTSPIKKFIDHYAWLGTRKEGYDALCNNFTESHQVKVLNQICKDIKYEIVSRNRKGKGSPETYLDDACRIHKSCHKDEEPLPDDLTDLEKGALAAIGYIHFRVHCICDN
jgi:hypothetical protein